MSFLKNAAKMIHLKDLACFQIKNNKKPTITCAAIFDDKAYLTNKNTLKPRCKEMWNLFIAHHISKHFIAFMRGTSFAISGSLVGILASIGICLLLFQMNFFENSIISSMIIEKLENSLPESDISIKSAALRWNDDKYTFEVILNKLRIDNIKIPKVCIDIDYGKFFKNWILIAKSISIINPKVQLYYDNSQLTLSPYLDEYSNGKLLLEPISVVHKFKSIVDFNTIIKLVDADIEIKESGLVWKLNNANCSYIIGNNTPISLDFSIMFPGVDYYSKITLLKDKLHENTYNAKITALNPKLLKSVLIKRNTPVNSNLLNIFNGYNIPICGDVSVTVKGTDVVSGTFNISGDNGYVSLPYKNMLLIEANKKIDKISMAGLFSKNLLTIDNAVIVQNNSEIQFSGLKLPMHNFVFDDVANIDGTVMLQNISMPALEEILPKNLLQSTIASIKEYIPCFTLESLKVDLSGPINFQQENLQNKQALTMSQGMFKIKDARIPVGDKFITDVSAIGQIVKDGLDIKLTSAFFDNNKINNGMFFISKNDGAWIGNININMNLKKASTYLNNISQNFKRFPISVFELDDIINLDLKIANAGGKTTRDTFAILEGAGVLKSKNKEKECTISWSDKAVSLNCNCNLNNQKISVNINENLAKNTGTSVVKTNSKNDFFKLYLPELAKIISGNYTITLTNNWSGDNDTFNVKALLHDNNYKLPMIGSINLGKQSKFSADFKKDANKYVFSNVVLKADDTNIAGEFDTNVFGDILNYSFNQFDVNGCSAKIAMKNTGAISEMSVVGVSAKLQNILEPIFSSSIGKDVTAYLDLEELKLLGTKVIKGVKAKIMCRDKKILSGSGYATLENKATVAMDAKQLPNNDGTVISVSSSDAGATLGYFGINNSIMGGHINFITKSVLTENGKVSGYLEITDFIVKNNHNLFKLLSLSSPTLIAQNDNISVGFNSFSSEIDIAGDNIKIRNGRLLGPSIVVSCNGEYDRKKDEIAINGMAVPMSSVLNSNNNNVLSSEYKLIGSLANPELSVSHLRLTPAEVAQNSFCGMLPINVIDNAVNDKIAPHMSPKLATNAFDKNAFDNVACEEISPANNVDVVKTTDKKEPIVDTKFGVQITRGL